MKIIRGIALFQRCLQFGNQFTGSLLLCLLLLPSLYLTASIPQFEDKRLIGKIIEGRYYGYNGLFSVAIPSLAEEKYTEDFYSLSNSGEVSFVNDFGFLLRVEVEELIPEVSFLISHHSAIKEETLDALFYDRYLPHMKKIIPDLQVLHQQKLVLDNGEPALFAVVNLSDAGTILDRKTGQSLDSKRGYLMTFSRDTFLVSFSMQDTVSLRPEWTDEKLKSLEKRLLNYLLRVQCTFQN